ncbi:MAG: virulence protein [Oscillospiraceae bacterium]|jgi:hypothetical protein|nr:virulence protein [Oscillospiraceae bacterium]
MEARFNVTGEARRRLVNAIVQELNIPTKYLGMPTAAYQIGDFTVSKDGTLSWPDDLNAAQVEKVIDGLARRGFDFIHERSDDASKAESPSDETPAHEGLTISYPADQFTPEVIDRLAQLINSKQTLLKKALNADNLPIRMGKDSAYLEFPWFQGTTDPVIIRAYEQLVQRLCLHAIAAKRILDVERPAPNERFAFRIFLVRLGMTGEEYRDARRILGRSLSGCSAWKAGAPTRLAAEATQPEEVEAV